MSFENKSGLGVYNSYGKRDTGGTAGSETTDGSVRTYSFTITGDSVNSGFFPKVVLPKGAKLTAAPTIIVDQAFAISTGGSVTIGGAGSDAVALTEAELEATGTKSASSTPAGNWVLNSATGTAAAGAFTIAKSGTVTAGQGKATVLFTFVQKAK